MENRLVGLDLEHCKLFFATLAQFHGLSAVYYEKFGRYADRFHQSLYRSEYKPMFEKWNNALFPELEKVYDRYESLKPYREKFVKWEDDIYDAICEIMTEKSDQFNVLNHGDAWMNNILFRHDDDGNPTELCFVDFQVPVFGTPMNDIMYFFASSPSLKVRENHFDELLNIYHTNLTEHLTKYNYPKPIPTMHDLQMMVLKHGLLASYFLTTIAPIALLDSEYSRPFDYFMKEGDKSDTFRYNLYNSPRYIKTLEVALKFFDCRGILEI